MKLLVRIDSQEKAVEIREVDGRYVLTIDGAERVVDCRNAGHRDYLSLIIDNKSHLVESAPIKFEEGTYFVNVYGRRYELDVLDERLVASRQAAAVVSDTGPHIIAAPMPGLIVDVRVRVGDTIAPGTPIVIMEAMKMQNELTSEVGGVVKAINVAPSDTVESQAPLVEIERSRESKEAE
jgi:biotin carboxyl carrier protein